jgi:flagellar basal body-associated protein FliL
MESPDMTKPTRRKKRSKLIAILLAPILSIIFIAGWSLYWIGQSRHQNEKQPQNPTPITKQDEFALIMIPQEEQMLTN